MKRRKKNRRVKEKPPDSSKMKAVTLYGGSKDSNLSESDKFMEEKDKTGRMVKLFWNKLEDIERKKKEIMEQLEGSWSNNMVQ